MYKLNFIKIMLRDLETGLKHVHGALAMVRLGGGVDAMGLTKFVQDLLHLYVDEHHLLRPTTKLPCGQDWLTGRETPVRWSELF
jgi:hypothetical protein